MDSYTLYQEEKVVFPRKSYETVYKNWKLSVERNTFDAWCGYIHCGEDSVRFFESKNIHGDWTYMDSTKIGFDCCHLGDYVPALPREGTQYWTLPQVWRELLRVCDEVAQDRERDIEPLAEAELVDDETETDTDYDSAS